MNADSIAGKIFVGSAIALVSALVGLFLGWATTRKAPPQAVIVPDAIETKALEFVEFSASASLDPDSDHLHYGWSIGGVAFDASPIASCEPKSDPALVVCRFVMPGTYAVSVEVTDADGLSSRASAPVTVDLAGGYIGIVPLSKRTKPDRDAAAEALLFAVDWASVQALVPKPILFPDPDHSGAVLYAVNVQRDLARAAAAVARLEEPSLKMIAFGLGMDGPDLVTAQAGEAGLEIVWVRLPAAEVSVAVQSGITDGGAIPVSSPAELSDLLKSLTDDE